MGFHLGKPILVMLLVALVSGVLLVSHTTPTRRELVLWTFTDIHTDTYAPILPDFELSSGKTVGMELLTPRALNVRLESMFMTGQDEPILPDLVEIEISHVGKFFRPPLDDIGLLPLNGFLKRDGWDQRILPARLASWSKQGVVFGVPHDVHPVSITYRDDLFREAGIDLSQMTTWPAFHEACLRFEKYWRERGYPTRHALELARGNSDMLTVMLQQRGINVVDQFENVHISEPIVAQTTAFYVQLVAGPRAVAAEAAGGKGMWATDALEGNICAFFTPDWRIFNFRKFTPELSGKLRMMPLPKFESSDSPTASWGGTMIGITRHSKNPEAAWKLIEHLYLSEEGLKARLRTTDILPPVIEQWSDPAFHRDDPFFAGQRVGELYVDLARQVRPRHVTPVTPIALTQLSVVVNFAARHVEKHGTEGLEQACQRWLDLAAADLKARIAHGRFEE